MDVRTSRSTKNNKYKTVQIKTSAPPFFVTSAKMMKTWWEEKTQLLANHENVFSPQYFQRRDFYFILSFTDTPKI